MKIINRRKIFTTNSTIGMLEIDGVQTGIYILEPTDLGLDDSMDIAAIQKIKAEHLAAKKEYVAIPTGKAYKLIMFAPPAAFLQRFTLFADGKTKELPLFEGIKGYGGVFIHAGTIETAQHQQSEGCNMPALELGTVADTTAKSNEGWLKLMQEIEAAIRAGNATYEPVRDAQAWAAFQATLVKQ